MIKVFFHIDEDVLKCIRRMAKQNKTSTAEQVRTLLEWGIESAVPPRLSGREPIDVWKARRLYDEVRSWREVAEKLTRADGTRYQPDAICKAVQRDARRGAGDN